MTRNIIVIAAAAVTLLAAAHVRADVITYQEGVGGYTHDATQARENEDSVVFGASATLDIGKITDGDASTTDDSYRIYLGYDLTGIPAGSVITDVTLALTLKDRGSEHSDTINLHRVTAAGPIAESGLNWNRYDSTNNWAVAGGDYDPMVLASTVATTGPVGTVHTWGSTPALVAAAQDALDVDGGRLEMILISAQEDAVTAVRYHGYYSDNDNTNLSFRPLLTVTYAIPEPGGIAAAAGIVGALMARGRSRRSV